MQRSPISPPNSRFSWFQMCPLRYLWRLQTGAAVVRCSWACLVSHRDPRGAT